MIKMLVPIDDDESSDEEVDDLQDEVTVSMQTTMDPLGINSLTWRNLSPAGTMKVMRGNRPRNKLCFSAPFK